MTEAEAEAALRRVREITEAHGLSALAREVDSAIDELGVREAREVTPREHLIRFLDALGAELTLAESLRAATPRLLMAGTDAQRAMIALPDVDDASANVPHAWGPLDITDPPEAEMAAMERLVAAIRELQLEATSQDE